MKHHRLIALLLFAGCSAAGAAPVYRCGNTYTQTPCEGATVVEASDPRTAAQRAEAKRIATAERQRAVDLARERRENVSPRQAQAAEAAASQPEPGRKPKGKRKVKTGPIQPIESFRGRKR